MARWSFLVVGIVLLCDVTLAKSPYPFGTYYNLFSAQSLWNSIPINPVLNTSASAGPQKSINGWNPVIADGAYSTGVFLATTSDPPVTIYPRSAGGINIADALEGVPNITLPRWPSDAAPATGSDGHCDIVDEVTGILHSFWILTNNVTTGQWTAEQYSWTYVNGTGFGDPAHYFIGARAAGVPTSAGILRQHEINDGYPMYYHALAMSLAQNSLGFNPTYIYPATSSDGDASYTNTGFIPEGALVMLPSTYNTSVHDAYPDVKKVAETLKVFGAYIVDRNYATPYVIYIENNSSAFLSSATDLIEIQNALRMVISADYYVDGNGDKLLPLTDVNLLSMRTTWTWELQYGDAVPRFDSWTQSLVYDGNNTKYTSHANTNFLGYDRVDWANIEANDTYTFAVEGEGDVGLILQVVVSGSVVYTTNRLNAGQNATFVLPTGGYLFFIAQKDPGGPGYVRGLLTSSDTSLYPVITPTAPMKERPFPYHISSSGSIKAQ